MHRFWVIGLTASACAVAASAADRGPSSRALDELAACRGIANDAERLACFDRATATLVSARSKGDVIVVDRATVVARKRAGFGLGGSEVLGEAEDKATEVTSLTSTIREVKPGGYARWTFALAEGGVWQTTEPTGFPPRTGASVTITKGMLGAYKARIGNDRAVKVARVR